MRLTIPGLGLLLVVPAVALAQAGRVEHLRRGDTTIVRTTGNGLWGPAHDAVEVLRIGGGSDATALVRVTMLAALPDGGVVLFDVKGLNGPSLRQFDRNGRSVRSIGRTGAGPGEYDRRGVIALTVTSDTTLAMLDYRNRRVNRYRPDGTAREGLPTEPGVGNGFGPTNKILSGPANSLFLRITSTAPSGQALTPAESESLSGYLHMSSTGKVLDTIASPGSWLKVPPRSQAEPTAHWLMLPDGRLALGVTDRLGLLLRAPHGGAAPTMIEATAAPIPFLPDERREMETYIAWGNAGGRSRSQALMPGRLPAVKPLWHDIVVDVEGRFWLSRHTTGVKGEPEKGPAVMGEDGKPVVYPTISWFEPPAYSGFRTDGTYLGEVRFPLDAKFITFVGDFAWAIIKDQDDQQFLVKYRLH